VVKDRQRLLGYTAILDTGSRNDHCQQTPVRVDEEAALAPFDVLMRIVAAELSFSVVLTE
jgi:hypothetical protein